MHIILYLGEGGGQLIKIESLPGKGPSRGGSGACSSLAAYSLRIILEVPSDHLTLVECEEATQTVTL